MRSIPTCLLTRSGIEARRPGTTHSLHPDLALLLSTSGSTGSPRVVRLSHENLGSNAAAIAEYLQLSPLDRGITALPMQYCYGLSVINSHLAVGAGVVLTNGSVVDRCFWDLVDVHGVTGLAGVPHTFDLLDRAGFPSMDLPSLRYLTQAGGRLPPHRVQEYVELGRRKGWDLYVMYGQTEATARMAYLPPSLAASHPTSIGIPDPRGSVRHRARRRLQRGRRRARLPGRQRHARLRRDAARTWRSEPPSTRSAPATWLDAPTMACTRSWVDAARFAKILGLRIDLDHLERLLADRSVEAICASNDDRLVVGTIDAPDEAAVRTLVQAETGLPPSRVAVTVLPAVPRLPNGKPDHLAVARSASDAVANGAAAEGHEVPADVDPDGAPRLRRGAAAPRHQRRRHLRRPRWATRCPTWRCRSRWRSTSASSRPTGPPPRSVISFPSSGRPRRLHQIETSVVLRALSIVMVVGTHIKLFTVSGGAHLLLGIAGYNYARFRGGPADRFRSIARIAVPSMVWLAIAIEAR